MTNPRFEPPKTWKPPTTPPSSAPTLPASAPQRTLTAPAATRTLRWEYQWETSLNSVSERAVDPPLPDRIAAEVLRAAAAGASGLMILVRGELGIGKSTLVGLLLSALQDRASEYVSTNPIASNAAMTCAVLEAGDLETPTDFAARVNNAIVASFGVVVLARPGTLDDAGQWIRRSPDATVTMRTFSPGRAVFHQCLKEVAAASGLDTVDGQDTLAALAGRLPSFLQTPFYFQELAFALRNASSLEESRHKSPFELFRDSLDRRIGRRGAFADLVDCALGRSLPEDVEPIPGILERDRFHHDGYRSVVLAVSVIDRSERFVSILQARNPKNAVLIVLDHMVYAWRGRRIDAADPLLLELREFVEGSGNSATTNIVYYQGLVAAAFRKLRDEGPAAHLRERCLQFIAARESTSPEEQSSLPYNLWWDISDALSAVGDPRLQSARRHGFSSTSGYFTLVTKCDVVIGSEFSPKRQDAAKPVLPYRRTSVRVGPVHVANFLVTNEQFAEFWSDPERDQYFTATGRQWVTGDPTVMAMIEESFSIAARRCFWKELAEQQSVAISGVAGGAMSILDVARLRALRQGRVALWDPTQTDERFSANGNPVVGVTWWEALAFCAWWTDRKLEDGGFPASAVATLLTDWEWEAIRRIYYEQQTPVDGPLFPPRRYPAHVRAVTRTSAKRQRVSNIMRPLHVGLTPVPSRKGPHDMVGNVWEWTRSRVFGQIIESQNTDEVPFGPTAWTDGDAAAESTPIHPLRDLTDDRNDLSYRAVRGGSFFSIDEQAAWHPAYRLCDPPFSSYFDLGFRFAVYPDGCTT